MVRNNICNININFFQTDKINEATDFLKFLIESKKDELNTLDENIINNINILIESIEQNKNSKTNEQLEEYKSLVISKDNEISKLNDINISKENEIKRLNQLIEDMKQGTPTQELEENFKIEKEKLLAKINNLELKIYNMKDEKGKETEKEKEKNDEVYLEEKEKEKEENNNNNRLSYEELMKIKEDIEQKNQELNVEIKLLKDNQEPNELNNNEENLKKIEELQNKILEYETGKIIPESTQKKLEENEAMLSELKEQNKILNENISNKSKNKKDFETIILKQEKKIMELNSLLKKKDLDILSKDNAANKNQIYSVQLMNIINEQKIKIEKIKKKNKEELNTQITELKREINNLQNILELKETMITNMKKTYKNLQDKYINMTFSKKRKERDDLLNQAKILKKQKMERNAHLNQQKNFSNIFNKKNKVKTNELNNISEIYPNVNTSPNSKLNKNKFLENDIVLPSINVNNPENIEENKDSLINEEKGKLDEINEMMKKVIDNEN